jgi:cytochrome c oxidase subunit 1/cytochrome c oxidase subunit I+III
LEWSIPSPPPPYNFKVIPHVTSRHPLWEGRLEESAVYSSLDAGMVLDHGRETVGTSPLDGEPDEILRMPKDSIAPFLLALATSAFFVGLLLHLWWLALAGAVVLALALLIWLWPERQLRQRVATQHV